MTDAAPTAIEPAVLISVRTAAAARPEPAAGAADVPLALPHGVDPHDLLAARGLRAERVVAADLTAPHTLTITVDASPVPARDVPANPTRRDPDVTDDELAGALRRRRIAAYALVRHDDTVLLTELSDAARTAPGAWTMPGGGIDPGEDPADAVVREVWEETGQRVTDLRLVAVSSDHWVGRAPDGTLEDFQPIRLLYTATCPDPTEPVVHDVGGTTSAAAWVPVTDVLTGRLTVVRSWVDALPPLLHP